MFRMGKGNKTLFECDVQGFHCPVCNRPVYVGIPFCKEHTKTELKLVVKRSRIPGAGDGLFAWSLNRNPTSNDVVFVKGDRICYYWGEHISVKELDRRYPGNIIGPYAIRNGEKGKGRYVEHAACVRGIGSLANHGGKHQSNAEYHYLRDPKRFVLVALRNIHHDEEILLDYGDNYDVADTTYWNRTVRVSYVDLTT